LALALTLGSLIMLRLRVVEPRTSVRSEA